MSELQTLSRKVRRALREVAIAFDSGESEAMPEDLETLHSAGLMTKTMRKTVRGKEPWYELNERGKRLVGEVLL